MPSAANPGPLVVTIAADDRPRQLIAEALSGAAEVIYLADLAGKARKDALRQAGVVLARNTAKELELDEPALIGQARLLQFVTAGVDFIPLSALPVGLPIAVN